MAANAGRAFLLKVDITGTPTTVGGMRTTSMTLNNETVDVTSKDDTQWRQLLATAGVSSMSISAAGVFKDSAAEETVRAAAFGNTQPTFTIAFGNGDTVAGSFAISSYERAGSYNGEETYSLTLQSAGNLTFTPAV